MTFRRATKANRLTERATSIRLPASILERLARAAQAHRRPMSEIIRAGIDGELLRLELAAPAPEARP